MVRLEQGWISLLIALASLSKTAVAVDSINLDLEVWDNIDMSVLGTPDLDRYGLTYNLTVDSSCQYSMKLSWKRPDGDVPGEAQNEFQGVCDPTAAASSGNAPDGKPWHDHRRQWLQFPQYVEQTMGFNHMAINWRPCGLPPAGFRQPRFEVNFYPTIPQYRAYWTCATFDDMEPKTCMYEQPDFRGRGHFSIPRLERDPQFLANMPLGFQPTAETPTAFQYEGLISYNDELVPATPAEWQLPTFHMSTYDGDVASWRAMIPHRFLTTNETTYESTQFYVHQTLLRLPGGWSVDYDPRVGDVNMELVGSAGMCGASFESAKRADLEKDES